MGMKEVLKSIKAAEEAADEKISSSSDEAVKVLQNARITASEIVQSANEDSLISTQETLENARSSAGDDASKVKSEGEKSVESIRSVAEQRRSEAAKLVLDSLISSIS
jgi:V/A-type H+-transporting ATPase subunit G/H